MLIIAIALAAASVAEQMAPAERGMVQCQSPNSVSKTCYSLSAVRRLDSGSYSFETTFLVDEVGGVTAKMRNTYFVRGSEICGRSFLKEIAGATFSSEGSPLSAADAREYRAKLRGQFGAIEGHALCTQIVTGADGEESIIGTLDGKRIPVGDYPMKWVSVRDGWRVAP